MPASTVSRRRVASSGSRAASALSGDRISPGRQRGRRRRSDDCTRLPVGQRLGHLVERRVKLPKLVLALLGNAVAEAASWTASSVGDASKKMADATVTASAVAAGAVVEAASRTATTVGDAGKKVADATVDASKQAANAIGDAASKVASLVKGTLGKSE